MSWLDARTARERILLIFGLPVALLAVGYQLVWMPLSEARASAHEEISAYRTIASAADAMRSRPDSERPAATSIDPRPIATRVTASAQSAAVTLRRLEPEGENIRVTIDDTAFVDVVSWLAELETDASVRIVALEMDRRPEPGVISARLTLGAAR